MTISRQMAFLVPITVCALYGCAGEAPVVEILDASPPELSAADDTKDDLTIRLRYSDPDGDLGGGVAAIHDCRAEGLVAELPIPEIANAEAVEAGVAIEGELTLVVADVGALTPTDTAPAACADLGVGAPDGGKQAFCVFLTDAAGNESAGACTRPVLITP